MAQNEHQYDQIKTAKFLTGDFENYVLKLNY